MRKIVLGSVALVTLVATSPLAWGHARMLRVATLIPRSTSDGLKTAPCGGVNRTGTSAVLTAGDTQTIRWEETIDHPGQYFIEFSAADDTGWVRLKAIPDIQRNGALNPLPHAYETTITVPNVSCDACTIRVIQEMTDRTPPTYYYSCADIKIVGGTNAPGGGTDTGTAVPDDLYTGTPEQAESAGGCQ